MLNSRYCLLWSMAHFPAETFENPSDELLYSTCVLLNSRIEGSGLDGEMLELTPRVALRRSDWKDSQSEVGMSRTNEPMRMRTGQIFGKH